MNGLNLFLGLLTVAVAAAIYFLTKATSKPKEEDALSINTVNTKTRKAYDSTPLSLDQQNRVRLLKNHFDLRNVGLDRKDRLTQVEITAAINKELQLDKSVTAYRRIWSK